MTWNQGRMINPFCCIFCQLRDWRKMPGWHIKFTAEASPSCVVIIEDATGYIVEGAAALQQVGDSLQFVSTPRGEPSQLNRFSKTIEGAGKKYGKQLCVCGHRRGMHYRGRVFLRQGHMLLCSECSCTDYVEDNS